MSDSRSPLDDPSARQTDPGQGPLARSSGVPRRHAVTFLGMAALAAAAGCGTTSVTRRRLEPLRAGDLASVPGRRVPTAPPEPTLVAPDSGGIAGLRPRGQWARGAPQAVLMNRMKPVRSITIHHDGMPPVSLTNPAAVAGRIELIRAGHRARGWGDIGYHLIVDPLGNAWQGRPLIWQGAHVKDRNEGNIGILVLGNFEVGRPTGAQLDALVRNLDVLGRFYRVSPRSIYTHREWPGTSTLCPGRNLQARMSGVRRSVG
jgi:hypothetical protein